MKKSLFSIFILLISLSIGARNVSEQEALAIAKSFVSSKTLTRSNSTELTLVWIGPDTETKSTADIPYYIYNIDKGGFVMVGGDTKAEPILAYSKDYSFRVDNMPSNVAYWMREMKSHVDNLRKMNSIANPTIEEWGGMLFAQDQSNADTILLKTALWNQDAPYNAYTPNKMPTGCVATAMSIIMHFHKWPDAGRGRLESYKYEDDNGITQTINGYDLGHPYNWDIMPYELDNYELDTERTRAIAQLMYDCGVMAKASYNLYGTGAVLTDLDAPVSRYMKYDNSAVGLNRMFHSAEEWNAIVKSNLLNRMPILYGGVEPAANVGHAFVVDGIDEKGRFHINFGWSGSNNGYYAMPYFSTYSQNHHMLCNLKPDEGGKQEDLIVSYQVMSPVDKTTNMAVDTIKAGHDYILKGAIANATTGRFSGSVAICKVGRDGVVQEFVSDTTQNYIEDLESYYIAEYEIDFRITTEISIGDYLAIYFKGNQNGDWRKANTMEEKDMNIYLTDRYYIDEVTSISYSKEDSVVVIKTKEKARVQITDSLGNDVTGGISNQNGEIAIDRKLFAVGRYRVELVVSDKDRMVFELVF